MQREDCFGRVDGNTFSLGHGRLGTWTIDTPQFRHGLPWGRPRQQVRGQQVRAQVRGQQVGGQQVGG